MKTGRLIGRILGVVLVFVMIATLVGSDNSSLITKGALIQKAGAAPSLTTWSRVSAPSEEGWVLAPGSTIIDYAVADGGETGYAIVWQDGSYYLLQSTNHASTWKDVTANVESELGRRGLGEVGHLVKVACDATNPSFVAVALKIAGGSLHVLISKDAGITFRDTGEVRDGSLGFGEIFDFVASVEVEGIRNLAIGGTDAGEAVLFRCLAIGDIATAWQDARYDGWDDSGRPTEFTSEAVVAIEFAPSWARDSTVLVATATGSDVYLQSGTWGELPEAWNQEAGFPDAVTIVEGASIPWETLGGATAGIATPQDYTGRDRTQRYVWVNVNYIDPDHGALGQVFRVRDRGVSPVMIQVAGTPWLSNVSYWGTIDEGKAIAGVLGDGAGGHTDCCQGVQVYRSDGVHDMDICCVPWRPACKPPTGSLDMEAFYVSPDKAYAVALWGDAHDEGAWSVSFDDGETWNQLSLVDTRIDYFSDVAVSPDCNQTMLVSANLNSGCGCDSVWYKAQNLADAPEYSGKWLRTWCGQLENNHGLLRLAPEETNGETVYLADYGSSRVYWNGLQTLGCWERGKATVDNIVDLAVKDEASIYALDASGLITMSDGGYGAPPTWCMPVDSRVEGGHTIALWGDEIIVGGQAGDVSYSTDGGDNFARLGDVGAEGYVIVAFDNYFDHNKTVYAALAGAGTGNGIHRWTVGASTKWTNLGAEPYDYTGLVLDNADGNPLTNPSTGGVLYASYITWTGDQILSGVARCLTPAGEVCCDESDWDYLTQGLTSNEAFVMVPRALKICGGLTPDTDSKLFAIDGSVPYDTETGTAGAIWSFVDYHAKAAPDLTSPAEGATIRADGRSCLNVAFTLRWTCQCDLSVYDLQIAQDEAFTEVILNIQDYEPSRGATPRYLVAKGTLSCGTYYWRVRAVDIATGQTIHSWWSEPRSFAVVGGKP